MKKRVAIIGGGASGVLAAFLLSDKFDVCIYERQNRILKKVLQSGNGMCNLTNAYLDVSKYNTDITSVLERFDLNKCIDTFEKIGLIIKSDNEGRYYPYSKRSASVVHVLNRAINEKNVKVLTDTCIEKIEYNNGFVLNGKFVSDYLVIATGSLAAISFKYNIYDALKPFNLKINPFKPALVGFKVEENVKSLSGLRVKASVSLIKNNEIIKKIDGEVQFKDDGLSGIVVMELSRYFDANGKYSLSLDLMSDYDEDKVRDVINKLYKREKSLEEVLMGILPKMIAVDISKRCKNIDEAIYLIKHYAFNIKTTYGFENCQVCKGGVDLSEIDLNTFASLKNKNLYFSGEVLDVDGTCGGYNLHFAWASAYIISEDLNKKGDKYE